VHTRNSYRVWSGIEHQGSGLIGEQLQGRLQTVEQPFVHKSGSGISAAHDQHPETATALYRGRVGGIFAHPM
jgi:hypothetical protein